MRSAEAPRKRGRDGRVQHALRLIKKSDRRLADIAHASGFNSQETMSRLFLRELGHPPSRFRNPA